MFSEGERMFNVRPDQFWPWIHFEPPSEDPPGFRMAADGSMRASAQSGSELPSDGSSPNPLEASPMTVQCGVVSQIFRISGPRGTILTLTSRSRQASAPMGFVPPGMTATR
jgi:hypothetical protein